jgi:cyclic di-GMP phosphodiesterase
VQTERILIVGDDPASRRSVAQPLIDKGFECAFAERPKDALEAMESCEFSVLLWHATPPVRGTLATIREIQDHFPGTAAIVLSDRDRPELGAAALDLGLAGYLVGPVCASQLLVNIDNALRRRQLERVSHGQSSGFRSASEPAHTSPPVPPHRSSSPRDTVDETLEEMLTRLCHVAEFRDLGGDSHIMRVSDNAHDLALLCDLDADHANRIRLASRFHDVGNVCVPYRILSKPGRLSEREYHSVKTHTQLGYRMLSGTDSEMLDLAASIALSHHERFDGSGYPAGLVGDEIPIEARIVSICDVFDTCTSRRVYKPAYTPNEALRILRRERGGMFDPEFLDQFFSLQDRDVH